MPDFDLCERLFKKALGQKDNDVSSIAANLAGLDAKNKVALIKGRSAKEIEVFLVKGRFVLRQDFPGADHFETSLNNQSGNDLHEPITGAEIELKSGPDKTDGNCGLNIVSWALGDMSDQRIREILNDSMMTRRELFIKGNTVGIEKNKAKTMNMLSEYFCERLQVDKEAPAKLRHFVASIARGITKGPQIKATFDGDDVSFPHLYQADWDNGLVRYEHSFLPKEQLVIKEVGVTESRAQIVCLGKESRVEARIYPNYKNSFKRGDVNIPAQNWVNTSCFHVWIKGAVGDS